MIGQPQILIRQRIDIGRLFYSAAASAVLQHAFYDAIRPLAMVKDLFQVLLYIPGNCFCFICISLINLFNHLTAATIEAWVRWERLDIRADLFDFGGTYEEFLDRVARYDPFRKREHMARTLKYNLLRRADGKYVSKHDRRRVEVTLVSAGADDGSDMRQRLKRACHRFEDLHGATHEAMARRIRALGIDILVDVKGATDGTLLPVLDRKSVV